MRPFIVGAALVLALVATARAQDQEPEPGSDEARRKSAQLIQQAAKLSNENGDVKKIQELAEQALALDPKGVMPNDFLSFFYDIKLGDGDKALEYVDRAIRAIGAEPQTTDEKIKKARLIEKKGTLTYSYKDDLEAARTIYQASLDTYPTAKTADTLSNLLHRLSGMSKDPKKKKEQAEKALYFAEKAIEFAPMVASKDPATQKMLLCKYKLQLALCHQVLGHADEAKKALEAIDPEDYNPNTAYNEALLAAVQDDEKKTREHLDAFMKTRPTPAARNQARKFIKNDPDFKKWIDTDAWKDYKTDEAVPDKEKDK